MVIWQQSLPLCKYTFNIGFLLTQKILLSHKYVKSFFNDKFINANSQKCFILKGVDLREHTNIFLLRTINHYVTLIMCTLSWFVPTGTSSEFFPPEYPPHWDIPTRSLDILLGNGVSQTRFTSNVVLEC